MKSHLVKNAHSQKLINHHPFDYKHHHAGYDVPEYGEHVHIRDTNNRTIQTLSNALRFASEHWNNNTDVDEDLLLGNTNTTGSSSSSIEMLNKIPSSSARKKIITSPIKRRRSKGKKLHKLNVSM